MGFLKHIIWLVVLFIAAEVTLHFFGLPTPLELIVLVLRAFGVFGPPP